MAEIREVAAEARGGQGVGGAVAGQEEDSYAAAAGRLFSAARGNLASLRATVAEAPAQLKAAVIAKVHQWMGNQAATEVAGGSSSSGTGGGSNWAGAGSPAAATAEAAGAVVGGGSGGSGGSGAGAENPELQRIASHAGAEVSDGGGFTYRITAGGAFEIIGAPPVKANAVGRLITMEGAYATAWQVLAKKVSGVGSATASLQAASSTANTQAPAAPVSVGTTAIPQAANAAPAQFQAGEELYHSKAATVGGDTLSIAQTRLALAGGTTYSLTGYLHEREEKEAKARLASDNKALKSTKLTKEARTALETDRDLALAEVETHQDNRADGTSMQQHAANLASGNVEQAAFYCSGLSLWTLAAAGYDLTAPLVGLKDGQPFVGEKWAVVMRDEKGKKTTNPKKAVTQQEEVVKTEVPTLRKLIDGDPIAIEIMTKAGSADFGKNVGRLDYTGYQTPDAQVDTGELPRAARGAAGAFAFAGIGEEVPAELQKPGDFAQSRRQTTAPGEATAAHHGAGHAWQVYSVEVTGGAYFGQPGSPVPAQAGLTGWHADVKYTITNDTDPALVGMHTVLKAARLEANVPESMRDKAGDSNSDGGVQITAPQRVGEGLVFYGRLGSSKWINWQPATAPQND